MLHQSTLTHTTWLHPRPTHCTPLLSLSHPLPGYSPDLPTAPLYCPCHTPYLATLQTYPLHPFTVPVTPLTWLLPRPTHCTPLLSLSHPLPGYSPDLPTAPLYCPCHTPYLATPQTYPLHPFTVPPSLSHPLLARQGERELGALGGGGGGPEREKKQRQPD